MNGNSRVIQYLKCFCIGAADAPFPVAACDKILKNIVDGTPTVKNIFRGLGVANDDAEYWIDSTKGEATSDGFRRFYYDNAAGSGTVYHSHIASYSGAFKPNTEYRILVEFRNVVSAYSFSPLVKNANHPTIFGDTPTLTIYSGHIKNGNSLIFTVNTAASFEGITKDLFASATTLKGGVTDFEARMSIYRADESPIHIDEVGSAVEGYLWDICNGTRIMAGHTPATNAEKLLAIKAGYQGIEQPLPMSELDEWLIYWINS